MIVCLLESRDNIINPQIPRFLQKFPNSCVGYVYERTSIDKLKQYQMPPLLTKGWLLICSVKNTNMIKNVVNLNDLNLVVFRAYSRKELEKLVETLSPLGKEINIIDNLLITRAQKVAYVMSQLKIEQKDALYLVNRHHGYVNDIVGSVKALSSFPVVTRDIIRRYTKETGGYRIFDVFNYLLGLDDGVTYSKAVKTVYQYRFGFEYLREYLVTNVVMYRCIFEYIDAGTLTLENHREFLKSCSDKRVSSLSEFQLNKAVESYSLVSIEWLYLLEQLLLKLDKRDITGLINILSMRKGGVSDV